MCPHKRLNLTSMKTQAVIDGYYFNMSMNLQIWQQQSLYKSRFVLMKTIQDVSEFVIFAGRTFRVLLLLNCWTTAVPQTLSPRLVPPPFLVQYTNSLFGHRRRRTKRLVLVPVGGAAVSCWCVASA